VKFLLLEYTKLKEYIEVSVHLAFQWFPMSNDRIKVFVDQVQSHPGLDHVSLWSVVLDGNRPGDFQRAEFPKSEARACSLPRYSNPSSTACCRLTSKFHVFPTGTASIPGPCEDLRFKARMIRAFLLVIQ